MSNRQDRVLLCWIFTIYSRNFTWCVALLCIYKIQIVPCNPGWKTCFEWCCNSVIYWCCSMLFASRKLKVSRRHVYDFVSTSGLQCWCNINSTWWFIIRFRAYSTRDQAGRRQGKWSILALNVDLMSSHIHFVTNRYFFLIVDLRLLRHNVSPWRLWNVIF